jgi:sirohydrochlorin cobaltochelatase
MQAFAALRRRQTPVGRIECCFAAVAQPSLTEALARAGESQYSRIVVQPHLLFRGRVLEEIAAAVERQASTTPGHEWVVAAHLGPSPFVAQTVVELARKGNSSTFSDWRGSA